MILERLRDDLFDTLNAVPIYRVQSKTDLRVDDVQQVRSTEDCNPMIDRTIGCPPKYLLPGYRVTFVRLDFGVKYIYYTDGQNQFTRPSQLPLPAPVAVSPDVLPAELVQLISQDFATKAGVAPEEIEVSVVEAAVWRNCFGLAPPPGASGACGPQGMQLGYQITLQTAKGTTCRYHAERVRPVDHLWYVGPVDPQTSGVDLGCMIPK